MQIKGKYSWIKHLDFMTVDLAALLLSFHLVYYFRYKTAALSPEWSRLLVIMGLFNLVIDLIANPYSGIFRRRYYQDIGRGFAVVAANFFCVMMVIYMLGMNEDYSREVLGCAYLLYGFVAMILKYGWKKLLTSGILSTKIARRTPMLLVSCAENAQRDINSVYATDLPLYEIAGVYLTDAVRRASAPVFYIHSNQYRKRKIPVIEGDIVDFVLEHNIGAVLVAASAGSISPETYQKLIDNGLAVALAVESLVGIQTEEQFVTNIGINRALSIGTFSFSPAQSFYLVIKRVLDILCGLIGLVILLPIAAIVKCSYLMSGDTANIFYRQKRVGLNGKHIRIWKFRSMVPHADEQLEELLKDGEYRREWEENQKIEHDPRITRIGRFLRRTSIDELPQLINVLAGDMSLVGPRPLVEGELASHNGLKLYEKVKPGITGWWGCNGRSNIDYRERLELEYYYVKNCSFYLDVLCIIRTVFAVLQKDGAQ